MTQPGVVIVTSDRETNHATFNKSTLYLLS